MGCSSARTSKAGCAGRDAASLLREHTYTAKPVETLTQLAVTHAQLAVTGNGPLLRVGAGCCVLGRCLFIGKLVCLVLCSLLRVALS